MNVPAFLLRKLYKRGSLRQVSAARFAFQLHNPLAKATLTSPPEFVINGMHFEPSQVHATDGVDLATIGPDTPYEFLRGSSLELTFPGHLLRGGNRIHLSVQTVEFDEIEFLVEDREAEFCDIGGEEE